MLNKRALATIAGVTAILAASAAHAGSTGYTSSDVNYANWAAAAGVITLNVDFDNANVNASYSGSGFIDSGVGPGQGNTSSTPLSNGEGTHAASNYLRLNRSGVVIFNFLTPVAAVGLDVIDYFNPSGATNGLAIAAYSGQDGNGFMVGDYGSAHFNFQQNHTYFMGLVSDQANIGSFVFVRGFDQTGDQLGIDNLRTGNGVSVSSAPEPAAWALMLVGFGGLGAMLRRRKVAPAIA